MRILFVDITCPKPYDPHTLATEAMGGTEATVVRVAEGLAEANLNNSVMVVQHNRSASYRDEEWPTKAYAEYLPWHYLDRLDRVDCVVALRNAPVLAILHNKYPDAKFVLWLHDLIGQGLDLFKAIPLLELTKTAVVGVSQFHKQDIVSGFMRHTDVFRGYTVQYIYNPIADDLRPNETPVDKNKLVFFSSPHKGLGQVATLFEHVRSQVPDIRLTIGNPGYISDTALRGNGIEVLGSLPHARILEEVRSSLAVFYPNTMYATRETFGLVFAEANAVGTPVIAHHMGAAPEVLDSQQAFDCNDVVKVVETVKNWQKHRPVVSGREEFRLSEAVKQWTNLMNLFFR